ncbi:MAG: pathogenicity locus [Methanothrix harundinacea]|nr:pathogenicity locus [Methanothrix harundinacea]
MPSLPALELQQIPGVGKSISEDLWQMGFRKVEELNQRDPEELYQRFCIMKQKPVDRCMLYVFRRAVYYASHRDHDPELLKWWNWKDGARRR